VGQLETTLAARTRANAPDAPEPRLVVTGLVELPEAQLDDRDAVAAYVRGLVARHVDALKLKEFGSRVLLAIASEGHAAGLPVFGHTWDAKGSFLAAALDARIDGVSHMYTFSEFANSHDPARPPAPTGLAYWVWIEELWLYQDAALLRQAMDRLLQQHVWLEPLLVTERYFTLPYPYPDDVAYLGDVRSLEQIARAWFPLGDSGWYRRRARAARIDAVYARQCDVVRQFHDRGGMIITGADESPAAIALLDEVSLLSHCGLTPMEAIQAATKDSATALGLRDTGTIEPGKRADLVLLDADPLADLANLRRVSRVIKGGHAYDPAALLEPITSSYSQRLYSAWRTRLAAAAITLIAIALGGAMWGRARAR
jgi:Amidohydrolase family